MSRVNLRSQKGVTDEPKQITLWQEDFPAGEYQLKPGDQHVRILIADTDNIDTSATDGNVVLRLPPIGVRGDREARPGTRISLELMYDTNKALRITGATVSQCVGAAYGGWAIEISSQGERLTFIAMPDLTWDVEAAGSVPGGNPFGGSVVEATVEEGRLFAGTRRVDEAAEVPFLFVEPLSPVQLTHRWYNADGVAYNGLPAVFDFDGNDGPGNGLALSSRGLVAASTPTGGYPEGIYVAAHTTGSSEESVSAAVLSLGGLSAAMVRMIRLFEANGVRFRFYDAEGVELCQTGVRPLSLHGDNTVAGIIKRSDYDTGNDRSHVNVEISLVPDTFTFTATSIRVEDGSGTFVLDGALDSPLVVVDGSPNGNVYVKDIGAGVVVANTNF
jgi:hypothetical protein